MGDVERCPWGPWHRALQIGPVDASGWRGSRRQALALALILDEIARHVRDLDEDLRARILDGCRGMLGQQ